MDKIGAEKGFSLEMDKIPSPFVSSTSEVFPSNSGTGCKTIIPRGNLQGRGSTLFPFEDFSCAKSFRGSSTDNRSLKTQQSSQFSKLSHDKSQYPSKLSRLPIMDDNSGHPGCVFTCPCQGNTSQVPSPIQRSSTLFFPVPTLRSGPCTSCVLGSDEIPSEQLASERDKRPGILGRFDNLGQDTAENEVSCTGGNSHSERIRLPDKLEKIRDRTITEDDMARNMLGIGKRDMLATRAINNKPNLISTRNVRIKPSFKETMGVSNGTSCIRSPIVQQSKIVLPSNNEAPVISLQKQGQDSRYPVGIDGFTHSMDNSNFSQNSISSEIPCPRNHNLDGCVPERVGSLLLHRQDLVRNVGHRLEPSPHQYPGTENCSSGSSGLGNQEASYSDRDGQLNNSLGCKQKRFNSNSDSESCSGIILVGRESSNLSVSSPHSRSSECSRRFSFEGFTSSDRVGPFTTRIRPARKSARIAARYRSVCNTSQPQDHAICNYDKSPKSSSSELVHSRLEQMVTNLPVSSHQSVTNGNTKTTVVPRSRVNHSSQTTQCRMVPIPEEPFLYPTTPGIAFPTGTGSSDRSLVNDLRAMDRLQFLKLLYCREFSAEVADKLLKAFRKSSNRQAEVGWRKFKEWLPQSAQIITKADVLDFLIFLESKELSPNTILAYKNSLRIPLEKGFGISFADIEFNLLAKAQFLTNPPTPKLIPQWSLEEALSVLSKKGNLSELQSKEQFLITLFLVAIATGNRVSELAAIDRRTISFSPNFVSVNLPIVPGFLYKNQSASRSPPPIVIPALENGSILCPVQALRIYLENTSLSKGKKLFLNPDTGSILNAGTLSFWLCKSINYLLPDTICNAHDTRKLAHSLAWARGVPASEIVKKGFWSSLSVFVKRYLVNMHTSGNISCVVAGNSV